jgi:tetratricopeptide (TPR) repeat protein
MSEAKFYFVKQTEQESQRLSSYLMLGQIQYQAEEYEKAEMAFRQALQEQKWSVEANYNLAILLERNGRFQEAGEHLEKVLEVAPFSIDASVRLINLYDHLGNPAKQTERLRKLLRLHPSSMEYAFLKENQNQDLRQTLYVYEEKFLSSDPSAPSSRAKAILASLREDYEQAIERYRRHLQTITRKSEKQRITNEIRRLEAVLEGKEPLRTSV